MLCIIGVHEESNQIKGIKQMPKTITDKCPWNPRIATIN